MFAEFGSEKAVELTYVTGVGVAVTSLSAGGAGVADGVSVAGILTFFQSSPCSTISAISSPTATSAELSGFCTQPTCTAAPSH